MKIFFGTVIRNAPVRDGGELVRLDWETKTIDAKVPIFPTNPDLDHDPNPRGNSRGCRGIYVWDDDLIATTYHTIKIFDKNLVQKRDLSHELMVGIHEINGQGNKVWLSSTAIDAVLEYDLKTESVTDQIWPREIPEFQKKFNLTPLEIEKQKDQRCNYLSSEHTRHPSHLHLNAVAQWKGEVYALFNSFGSIVNLSKKKVVIEDSALKKGHNLLILNDGIAIANDTRGQTVRFYDLSRQKLLKKINLRQFSWVQNLEKVGNIKNIPRKIGAKLSGRKSSVAQPLFVRGLDWDKETNFLFVGISPASILCLDWEKEKLLDAYNYSHNLRHCIHGLKVLQNFDDLSV